MQTHVVNSNNFSPCSLHLCHSPVPQYNQLSEGDTLLLYGDTSIINGHQSYKIQVYTVHVDQEILLLVQVPTNTRDGGQ